MSFSYPPNHTNLGYVSSSSSHTVSSATMMNKFVEFAYRKQMLLATLLSSALGVSICIFIGLKFFKEFLSVQYDDSFITYRYAFNLAHGEGLRFNPGDNSNSASSFLYVLILALIHFVLRIDIMDIATTINVLSVGIMSSLIFLIFVRRGVNFRNVVAGCLAICILASSARLIYWTFSGMETAFFMMLLFAAVFLTSNYVENYKRRRYGHISLLIVLALLTLTRIEGAIVATTLGALIVLFDYFYNDHKIQKINLLFIFTSPVIFATQLTFYWFYYGSPISDPIGFKDRVQYYQRTPGSALETALRFLKEESLWLLALVALLTVLVLVLKQWTIINRIAAPVASFALLFLFVLRSPNSDELRYELVLLVPLLLITTELASVVIQNVERVIFVPVAAVMFVASLLTFESGLDQALAIEVRTSRYQYVQGARIEASKWLEGNTQPGTIVISSDIGALAYYNPSNVYIDAAGLVNRTHLNNVVGGGDVFLSLSSRKPQILADTIGTDGISGVEQIMSNPNGYYVESSGVTTSCPVTPFRKSELKVFPDSPTSNLTIQIARILGYNC